MTSAPTEPAQSLFSEDTQAISWAEGIDFEYGTCSNIFTMWRGDQSGLIFLNPRPAPQSLSIIYPASYEPYHFDRFPALVRRARSFVQKRKVIAIKAIAPEHARIIDIGCGNGTLLRLLRAYGSSGWQLHGNEINEHCAHQLSAEGFQVHACPVWEIPGSSEYDIVILNQVIEHFADIRRLLESCNRLLKRGGFVFIETPSTEGIDARLFRRRYWGGYHFPRHFYLFNERTLERLLKEHGFEPVRTQYLASPAFWLQSVHHYLTDRGMKKLASFFSVRNVPLLALVTLIDLATAMLGQKTSNMRIVGRRLV